MKLTVLFLSTLLFITILFVTSIASVKADISNDVNVNSESKSGDSSVDVNINNQVNTDNNINSASSETNTKVEIHQEGEGTSQVKVNDKEWVLEGPGDISVNESGESAFTPTPLSDEEESEQPTDLGEETDIPSEDDTSRSLPEIINEKVENILELIRETVLDFLGRF